MKWNLWEVNCCTCILRIRRGQMTSATAHVRVSTDDQCLCSWEGQHWWPVPLLMGGSALSRAGNKRRRRPNDRLFTLTTDGNFVPQVNMETRPGDWFYIQQCASREREQLLWLEQRKSQVWQERALITGPTSHRSHWVRLPSSIVILSINDRCHMTQRMQGVRVTHWTQTHPQSQKCSIT